METRYSWCYFVTCPRCGAGVDEPCSRYPKGTPTKPHAARVNRAHQVEKLQEEGV